MSKHIFSKNTFILQSPDHTDALAAKLALILKKGDVVALYGDLGTGKTTIARQIIRQLMGPDENGNLINVTSPTFNLLQKYDYEANKLSPLSKKQIKYSEEFDLKLPDRNVDDDGQCINNSGEIFHFDLYRLSYPEEVFELGIEEAWSNISIIEWPEIIEDLLPKDTIKIYLSILSDGTRECVIHL